MAIPSGSGTEVLKRVTLHANNDAWTELFSGTANHIYTILSIVFCNNTSSTYGIGIRINDGTNDISILNGQSVAGYQTFVFNDKFVLEEDDDLDVYNEHSDGDWYMTYIDQDWT
tara:strand:- start:263 stop:604 length:342 start_codon:yes stop_codon:yes gene_type:complete